MASEARRLQFETAQRELEAAVETVRGASDAALPAAEEQLKNAQAEADRCRANLEREDQLKDCPPIKVDKRHGMDDRDRVALRNDQSVADYLREKGDATPDNLSLGKCLRGLALGRWDHAEAEQRAMAEGAIATGGAIVPEFLAGRLIDMARAQAVAFRAGAMTIPLETKTTKYARLTGEPAGAWRAENDPLTDEDLTFDNVTFEAKTFAVLLKAPVELVADAVNFDMAVQNSFAKILANKLDYAVLIGGGDHTPTGITLTGSVGVAPVHETGANLADYDDFLDAIGTVRADNFEPNACCANPDVYLQLSKLKDADLKQLAQPREYADLAKYATTQIPFAGAGSGIPNTTEAIIGQWDQCMVGIHTDQVRFRVLDQAFMASNLQIGFLAYIRADVQLAHPEAFCLVNHITASA